MGCKRAIFLYASAVDILALLPQISSGTGSSRMTKQRTAIKMYMFCTPSPLVQGVKGEKYNDGEGVATETSAPTTQSNGIILEITTASHTVQSLI